MPASFRLANFLSTVAINGLSRPNRFEVWIQSPSNGIAMDTLTSMFCEVTRFPGMTLQVKTNKIFGPSYPMPITPEYNGETLEMTFFVDRDMQVKRYFDQWMHNVVNQGYYTIAYRFQYVRDMYIRQLDEKERVTYAMRILEAYPRAIRDLELNQSADNMAHRLGITFAFRAWETVDFGGGDGVDVRPINVISNRPADDSVLRRPQDPPPPVGPTGRQIGPDGREFGPVIRNPAPATIPR